MTASEWAEVLFKAVTVLSCVLLWARVRRVERVIESADDRTDWTR